MAYSLSKTVRISFKRQDTWENKLTLERLFSIFKNLPHDTVIKVIGTSYNTDTLWIELYNDKFPESPVGMGMWEVDVKFEEGSKYILWPKEFDDLFNKDINDDFDIWNNESPAVQKIDTKIAIPVCEHQWFLTSRFSAFKHCKNCGTVSENEHVHD